jgi:signal peptidase II
MEMEFIIIAFGLFLDRITKIWSKGTLKDKNDIIVIKDFFGFTYTENRGAAFSIFQNKVLFLAIVTSIVITIMIYYLIKLRKDSILVRISLSLIIGGAIGNLIDRIYYGYVVDFIMFHYRDIYTFPIFNIADIMVVVGTGLLALYIIKDVN